MKIAIVYDWIDKWGGVERLLLHLNELFPEAHWYTSYHDVKSAPWSEKLNVKTSFIQRLPRFIRSNRLFSLLFYPYAFESFDLSDYDVVISVTSSFAKSVITNPNTKHICYLLTPTRYLWGMSDDYISGWKKIIATPLLRQLRKWDYVAAQRPDKLVAISHFVAKRSEKYYGRKAEVIYPPFNIDYWKNLKISNNLPESIQKSGYYLLVSRLEPYKKVDLAISAFSKRSDNLVIVGKGSQKGTLQKNAGKNIHFIENLSDEELVGLYSKAKALLMPQEEDFGYVALEATVFGCPVISFSESGAAEIIGDTKNSFLFHQQTVVSLGEALERFEAVAYNVESRKAVNSEKFSKTSFKNNLLSLIKN